MKILLILILLSSTIGWSAETLNKGDLAPYDGVIFNNEEANELVATDKKVLVLEKLRIQYEDKIELQEQRIGLLRGSLEDQNKFWKIGNVGWFSIGVGSGFLAIYATSVIINNLK